MAFSAYDLLSHGLYSGDTAEVANTDKEEAVYILSLGLLKTTTTPVAGDKDSGGLNDVGTSTRL